MNTLQSEFRRIFSERQLNAFIERYGLSSHGLNQSPRSQVYKVVGGVVDGRDVVVLHRWFDPSNAFSLLPDVSKAELSIDGQHVETIEWSED
ncbi:MAG: hypothetical protein ACK4OH_15700 [Acidovorax temperans]|jgi:hypothetical protein|uniref:hypothetical protein n=1 Tax=Acidovorax temperans TaxID=80878 RepID=UPI003918C700